MKPEIHTAARLSDLLDPDMLQGIGSAFARLTGLAMSLRDDDGRLIAEQAGESAFCRMTMSSSSGRAACDRSHREAVEFACMTSAPCTPHCHAGRAQVAVNPRAEGPVAPAGDGGRWYSAGCEVGRRRARPGPAVERRHDRRA